MKKGERMKNVSVLDLAEGLQCLEEDSKERGGTPYEDGTGYGMRLAVDQLRELIPEVRPEVRLIQWMRNKPTVTARDVARKRIVRTMAEARTLLESLASKGRIQRKEEIPMNGGHKRVYFQLSNEL